MASLVRRPDSRYYQIQFRVAGKIRRISTETDVLQIAKEKLRRFQSAQLGGTDLPFPTKTPIAEVVEAYVAHIRQTKTPKSAQTDIYYLRDIFGPITQGLIVTCRRLSDKAKKRPVKEGQDRRRKAAILEASCFEAITTLSISNFISAQVQSRGLAPKTANRYREILVRLFNWAMEQRGIRLPADKNPAAPVERYRERAPKIRFLTLEQIDEQLAALAGKPQLQAMVAMMIYAGLRREELLWLTQDDIDFRTGVHGMIRVRAKVVGDAAWQPKTKVNRAVPIGSKLRAYLDKHKPMATPGRWYFPSPEGKRWDADNFSSDLREVNEKVGLAWANLDFRHTFGSQLAMKGESLYKISQLMGNSPEICRRHYAALVPEAMADSVEFPTKPQPPKQAA